MAGRRLSPPRRRGPTGVFALNTLTYLQSEREIVEAGDDVVSRATRTLDIFDRDLSGFGYALPSRVEKLHAFLLMNRSNQVRIAVQRTDFLLARCPSLCNLLRYFSHAVTVRQTLPEIEHLADAFIVADGMHVVHRIHHAHSRGKVALDWEEEASPFATRFSEVWALCDRAISPTPLGL